MDAREEAVKKLLLQVRRELADRIEGDEQIRRLFEALMNGEGGYIEAEDYAYEVGGAMAEIFGAHLEEIAGMRTYGEISDFLFGAMGRLHELSAQGATAAQEAMNRRAELGMKAKAPELDSGRVYGLANKVAAAAGDPEQIEKILSEPVKNFAQHVVDATLKRNADFQVSAGLRPRIVRKARGTCCAWCAALEGTYDYPDVPDDVYRRHERCRCSVEYDPDDKKGLRQDVWTKDWTTPEDRAKIEERERLGTSVIKSLIEDPRELGGYTPGELKRALEAQGYKVKPLSDGKLKGIPLEEGGGFKVNFSDGGVLMYHPEKWSHHKGAYYKISTGKSGRHRYALDGTEKLK